MQLLFLKFIRQPQLLTLLPLPLLQLLTREFALQPAASENVLDPGFFGLVLESELLTVAAHPVLVLVDSNDWTVVRRMLTLVLHSQRPLLISVDSHINNFLDEADSFLGAWAEWRLQISLFLLWLPAFSTTQWCGSFLRRQSRRAARFRLRAQWAVQISLALDLESLWNTIHLFNYY